MSRRICVITGSRAEYGHLRWLLADLARDTRVELQLLVTGMHLEPRFGETYREIEADGYAIDARVPIDETDDSPTGIAATMGRALDGVARALAELAPDLAVILGDRFEMLPAAQAATVSRIPIAHIHGGETTEGAFDEAIRHALTKMAHLHFAAAAPYAQRIVQLGEQPDRVYQVGAPGLCALQRERLLGRDDLAEALGFPLGERLFLVTYHPVTLSSADPAEAVDAMLGGLDRYPDATVLITGVNADTAHTRIEAVYAAYAQARPERFRLVKHLGQQRYLSALQHADLCVGNSSSGLIEAPALGVPTVNIGPRQQGRLRAASVIDCPAERDAIAAAVEKALAPAFVRQARDQEPPYGSGGAAERIAEALATHDLQDILVKRFYDLPGTDPAAPAQ